MGKNNPQFKENQKSKNGSLQANKEWGKSKIIINQINRFTMNHTNCPKIV